MVASATQTNTSTRYILHPLRKSYGLCKNLLCKVRYYLTRNDVFSKKSKYLLYEIHFASLLQFFRTLWNVFLVDFSSLRIQKIYRFLIVCLGLCLFELTNSSYVLACTDIASNAHYGYGSFRQQLWHNLPITLILLLLIMYTIRFVINTKDVFSGGTSKKIRK